MAKIIVTRSTPEQYVPPPATVPALSINIQWQLEVLPSGKLLVPGCEPTSALSSAKLSSWMAKAGCKNVMVSVQDALAAIPGSYLKYGTHFGRGNMRQTWFVMPPIDPDCPCTQYPDYYRILRELASEEAPVEEVYDACNISGMGYCPSGDFVEPPPPDPYKEEGTLPAGVGILPPIPPWATVSSPTHTPPVETPPDETPPDETPPDETITLVASDANYDCTEATLNVSAPGLLAYCSGNTNLFVELADGPSDGSIVINTDGSFVYTRIGTAAYTTSFTYRCYDDDNRVSNVATVTIAVAALDSGNTPIAANGSYTFSDAIYSVSAPGVLALCSDADGQVLSAELVSGPGTGTLVLNADGSFVYTSDGANYSTTFTYRAIDTDGNHSNTATIILAVTGVAGSIYPTSYYSWFNDFCLDNFSDSDSVNEYDNIPMSSDTLEFVVDADWVYESRNSITIGFKTSLPTTAQVRYAKSGTNDWYTTNVEERPYFLHLHHLRDLERNTTYKYELIASDSLGTITSAERTAATSDTVDVILIPDDFPGGPPYVLSTPNATYQLTQDIDAPQRAITIDASDVTLDLNGYKITYDNQAPLVTGSWDQYVYSDISTFGVYCSAGSKLYNGTIEQGVYGSGGNIGYGANPVYKSQDGCEFAGLTTRWRGESSGGFAGGYSSDGIMHHCVVEDHGHVIDNRHQGIRAVQFTTVSDPNTQGIRYVRVSRARQLGISTSGVVEHCEVYGDSFSTNSFCVQGTDRVHNNLIFGTGYHCIGIGWGCDDVKYNYINLYVWPCDRDTEYGTDGSGVGIRLTQYGGSTVAFPSYRWSNNTIIVRSEGASIIRGIQVTTDPYVTDMLISDNYIKALSVDGVTPQLDKAMACIAFNGLSDRLETPQDPVVVTGNILASNVGMISFGESYGVGFRARIVRNTFRKIGSYNFFNAILHKYMYWASRYSVILSNVLENGATQDGYMGTHSDNKISDWKTGRIVTVNVTSGGVPQENVSVLYQDDHGDSASGMTNALGKIEFDVIDYDKVSPGNNVAAYQVARTGHRVTINGFEYEIPAGVEEFTHNIV